MDMNIHPFGAGLPRLVGPAGIGCDFSGFSGPDFSSQWRVIPNGTSPVQDFQYQRDTLHMISSAQLAKIRARFATPGRHAAHAKPLKFGDELGKPGSPRSPGQTSVFDALQQSPHFLLQDGSGSSPRGKWLSSHTRTMNQKVKTEELGGLEGTFMQELEPSAEPLKSVDELGKPGSHRSPGQINVFDALEQSPCYLLQDGSGNSLRRKLPDSQTRTINQNAKIEEPGGLEDTFMEELEPSAKPLKLGDELDKPGSPHSPGQTNVFDVLEESSHYLLQDGSGSSPGRKLPDSHTRTMDKKPISEKLWGLDILDIFMEGLEPLAETLNLGNELGNPGQTDVFDALQQSPYFLTARWAGEQPPQETA